MNIALYIRMSTDKQESSIASQQAVLLAYAKSHKMKIMEKYIDEGLSGRKATKRPSFMQMIEDSAKGDFEAVLVYDSSRFARNLEESIVYKSTLKRNGVALISATEPTLDDDSALITDAMLGALNEMHSRKLSKAVKRGMEYKAQQGIYQVPPPFGYKKSNGIVEIIPDEAIAVQKVYEMFIECPSWHSVAVKMNEQGIQKRNAYGWYARDIKRMLTNPAYIGNVYYDGKIYKGRHEPIINEDLWKRVQDIIAAKPSGRTRSSLSYKHWLSGLIKCGHCGGRMNHITDNKGNRSFRCSKNANGACAYSNFISIPKMEKLVMKALDTLVHDNNLAEYQYFMPKSKNNNLSESLKKRLKNNAARLERHKAAYSSGVDTLEEYKENKIQCQRERDEIQKQMQTLSEESTNDKRLNDIRSGAEHLLPYLSDDTYDVEQKSIAIKKTIEKIVFNKKNGTMTVFYFL